MRIVISTSLVDKDALRLTRLVIECTRKGIIPDSNVGAIISTREKGDNPGTDERLSALEGCGVPVIAVSARKNGRLERPVTSKIKEKYDALVMSQLQTRLSVGPDILVLLGDMMVHGEKWCREMPPGLNLHPDIPGGFKGIYWDVIAEWVRSSREEIGGMVHLVSLELDAGRPVAYFKAPSRGRIKGVDLAPLWDLLPSDVLERAALIGIQVSLRDKPTHPLFQGLRLAETGFESRLVIATLIALARGEIAIREGRVFDSRGKEINGGVDLTDMVVRNRVVWPERRAKER